MKRKIVSLVLFFLIIVQLNQNLYASTSQEENKNTQDIVNCVEASNMAMEHIYSTIKLDSNSSWKSDTYIAEKRVLFNLDNEVSAYYFKLKNGNEDNGYIIVSSERNVNPIIEFSYSEDGFIDKALQETSLALQDEKVDKINSSKLIYTGGLNYFVEYDTDEKDVLYDI